MKIIFITYQNRSGSTFLANELSKHKDVFVCPEAEVLVNLFLKHANKQIVSKNNNLKNKLKKDDKFQFWKISPNFLESRTGLEIFIKIVSEYKKAHKLNASIIVFKGDNIIKYYKTIKDANQNKHDIKFISLIRDSRAVFLSQKTTVGLWNIPMNINPINSAIKWSRFSKISHKYNFLYNDIHIVKYENLISKFNDVYLDIISSIFMLNPENNLSSNADLFDRIPQNQLSMHKNIEKKPIIENIDKWKNELSSIEINMIESFSENQLIANDYVLLKPQKKKIDIFKSLIFILKHIYSSLHDNISRRIN